MSNFLFLNPWLLGAFIALPALWFLLRIMPPAPKKVFLPSARFLDGLVPATQTPNKTPWWILLLRLIIISLVITAMAQPVLNPSGQLKSKDPVHLILENGWSSADHWDTKLKTAEDFIAQAKRRNLSVYLSTTANEANDNAPLSLGPLSADEALSRLKGLSPYPWHSNYKALIEASDNIDTKTHSILLSDGLDARQLDDFIKVLKSNGDVQIITPKPEDLPILIRRGDDQDGNPSFILQSPDTLPSGTPISLQATSSNGQILGLENVIFETSKIDVVMQLPDRLRQDLSAVRINERKGSGALYLFGDQFQKKNVGIAAPTKEDEAKPFIEASFYLNRALEPFAEIQTGDLDTLLTSNLSMIILPDIGAFTSSQLEQLDQWVRGGGLLLRFAGPAMEQARQQFLVPTPLRNSARSLDGALTWENPPKLQSFNADTPLSGIDIHDEIVIKQQILAEPTQDLQSKTWAQLDDGTPLITADHLDDGLIVMVHTSASPDWSNLPLSGAYVQILSRLTKIAGTPPESMQAATGMFEPVRVLDGFGKLTKPHINAKMVEAKDFETLKISNLHPPGIYAQGSVQKTLNLGDTISHLSAIPDFSVSQSTYGIDYETKLMPSLLILALILLMADWAIMLVLSGLFQMRQVSRAALVIITLGLSFPNNAAAEIPEAYRYADGLYLGFIKSSNSNVNATTRKGLEALKDALTMRTSAEPDGVVALDPETDILAFFPVIYWPVDAGDQPLSDTALRNVQDYLDHGGTILFDTREDVSSADPTQGGRNSDALVRITQGLNIPALSPIKSDHVLGRSFYLLDTFPGQYSGGEIWVESNSENGRDGVSSVLIGSHDWAAAWAQSAGRDYRSGTSARQRELAMRFGVNLTMYALTGNYKADQVHVKYILERLGQ